MSYGEVQISGGTTWLAFIQQDGGSGAQIDCKFTNMAGLADTEADAFFQAFVDHLSSMPGMTVVQASKDRSATQQIAPTSA